MNTYGEDSLIALVVCARIRFRSSVRVVFTIAVFRVIADLQPFVVFDSFAFERSKFLVLLFFFSLSIRASLTHFWLFCCCCRVPLLLVHFLLVFFIESFLFFMCCAFFSFKFLLSSASHTCAFVCVLCVFFIVSEFLVECMCDVR